MSARDGISIVAVSMGIFLFGCGEAVQQPHESAADSVAARVNVSADSDPRAIEIAQAVMERMGGWDSWDRTRFVRWNFFGRRTHHWDRRTGDIRIDADDLVILMNINTRQGRAWKAGQPVEAGEALDAVLLEGHQTWVNDSYWMFMPYKLLDPDVTLKYAGERNLEDGRPADVIDLTFAAGAGYTPQNRYEIFVPRDSGLVEAWSFFTDAAEQEPRFTLPWENWQRFGEIMLATGHGRGLDWEIAVFDDLPSGVFTDPAPVGG